MKQHWLKDYIQHCIKTQSDTLMYMSEVSKDSYIYQVNEVKFNLVNIYIQILLHVQLWRNL
jgi:hypothetical protein